MKHFKKIVSLILTLVFVLPLIPLSASGAAEDSAFYLLPEDNEGLTFSVGSYEKTSNQSYMFLPNTVAPECVKVRYSADFGEVSGFSVTEWNEDEKYFVVDTTADSEVWVDNKVLTFMQSCLPSISIDINEGESLSTIHADKNAKIGAKASISGASKDKYNLAPTDIQFKTRGYSSFSAPKKPYQIKFDKKQDLFGLGKAKKWILLANYFDGSSIRTKVFFDLADEIGLSYTSQSVFVDLYIDGAYQGVYQVIEKIEVGDARVPLKNELGAILEMECNPRVEASDIWFTSSVTDKAFLYKDYVTDLEDTSTPEKAEKVSEVKQFIEARINAFEEAIYADEPDWDLISSMIDVDSFIKYYFLNEYGEQTDCTFSSTYFYIDGPEDVIHCGPVWDFDRACGFNREIPQNSDFLKNIDEYTDGYRVEWFKQLFRNPEFVVRANEIYDEVIRDAFDTDKVTAAIDEAQAAIMPSLLMNHVIWVVSFNDYHTANDVVSGGTAARVAHTTNSIKTIITNKKAYLDTAYGVDIPVISYTCYKTDGTANKNYTGGCVTPTSSLAGLSVELIGSKFDGRIDYRLRVGDSQTDVCCNGEVTHASNGFSKAQGIYVKLIGNVAEYFNVQYRVHIAGNWSSWIQNGSYCGRFNNTGYVDRVQIRLTQKKPVEYVAVEYVARDLETVTEDVISGNTVKPSYIPELAGYRFTGWFTDEERTEALADDFVPTESDRTLYASMVLIGDLDGNDKLTSRDISALKRYIAGSIPEDQVDLVAADANGDGKITSKDIAAVKKLVANG